MRTLRLLISSGTKFQKWVQCKREAFIRHQVRDLLTTRIREHVLDANDSAAFAVTLDKVLDLIPNREGATRSQLMQSFKKRDFPLLRFTVCAVCAEN